MCLKLVVSTLCSGGDGVYFTSGMLLGDTKLPRSWWPALWWDKSERRLMSSPSFLITVGVLAFSLRLFSPNRTYITLDFPIHPSGAFGRRSYWQTLLLVLFFILQILGVLTLELHQRFSAPSVVYIKCVCMVLAVLSQHYTTHAAGNTIWVPLYLLVVIVSGLKHIGFVGGKVSSLFQILRRKCRLLGA